MPPKKTKKTVSPFSLGSWTLALCIGLSVLAYAVFAFITIVDATAAGKFLPHMRIGDVEIGGMTVEEAEQAVTDRVQALQESGITLTFAGEQFTVETTLTDPANPEISIPLVSYSVQETVRGLRDELDAMTYAGRARALIFGLTSTPISTVDTEKLLLALDGALAQYETPAVDAKLVVNETGITVDAEASGQAFDYDELASTITDQFTRLAAPTATVELQLDEPDVTSAEAEALIPEAQQVIDGAPYLVVYDDKKWAIDAELTKSMLGVFSEATTSTASADSRVLGTTDTIVVGLLPEKLQEYLETTIVKDINIEAQRGKFEMQNGRVAEFQPSRTGLTLDIDESIKEINDVIQSGILTGEAETATLVVIETEPDVTVGDVNTFGIKELVGSGTTNFKGSPKNRRFNIAHAAEKLNGILIAPGEEFSLVKALSPIDAANGYLPELVIKGSRTIPEVGGGLCQIGTTFFRVVLDAGLPIVERKNHSYRVSYYEPPVGMDATIYDPKPDFRFTNDYNSHLLLQTRVEGDNITFELYGTADGRKVSATEPRIYNVVKPGPTKIIETTDLKPGERKCIEKAHNGADAEFTYTVAYADGRTESEVFKSHYKAWPEVCLVGVAETSPDTQQTQLENVKTE